MQVKAHARYIRMSPRKLRLVANLIRGLKTDEAIFQLKFTNKLATKPILKLVNSAIANAMNNFNLEKNNLYIKEIKVDQGPTLKRTIPKAFGRAALIRRRSSHISIVLDELVSSKKKVKTVKAKKMEEPVMVDQKPKEKEISQAVTEEVREKDRETNSADEEKEIMDVRRVGKHREKQHLDKIRGKEKGGRLKRIFRRKSV